MDVVNVESANLDDLKKRFVEICATINRPGMEDLMAWLERSDFYTAPASTRFHGNYTGGLLEHSLNVYDKLSGFVARYPELEISPETVAVTALFHDLTKVNYYTVSSRNVKDDVTGAWHKERSTKRKIVSRLVMARNLSLSCRASSSSHVTKSLQSAGIWVALIVQSKAGITVWAMLSRLARWQL